jgi:hypothetical protein
MTEPITQPALNLCPFCAGRAILTRRAGGWTIDCEWYDPIHCVEQNHPECRFAGTDFFDTPEQAIEFWNRRPGEEALNAECNSWVSKNERLEDALHRIEQWAQAYPLDVFPEPDFKRARELLAAGGISLDSISASNMRHVVEGVGKIARGALEANQ